MRSLLWSAPEARLNCEKLSLHPPERAAEQCPSERGSSAFLLLWVLA
jgi:hypothetical protein